VDAGGLGRISGLINGLFAAWYHAVPIVSRAQVRAAEAMQMITREHHNVFLPPTALKLMRQSGVKNPASSPQHLHRQQCSVANCSTGAYRPASTRMSVRPDEVNRDRQQRKTFPIRPGSMGKATPGLTLRMSTIRARVPRGPRHHRRAPANPTILECGNRGTAKKYAGEFQRPATIGVQDEDGYFWPNVSHEDDVSPPRAIRSARRRSGTR
jgi:acetyl-CoA synthetase